MKSGFNMEHFQEREKVANISITVTKEAVEEGYMGKPKGAAQIAYDRDFIDLEGKLADGRKSIMQGFSSKDAVTGVVTVDRTTSVLRILS